MIEKIINNELGSYTDRFNHGHRVGAFGLYNCINSYESPPENEYWERCPCCGLRPRIWEYNNGRQTACGCGSSKYYHFSVCAESITSVHARCDGNISEYDSDALRKNWNEYCATMVNPCSLQDLIFEGKW